MPVAERPQHMEALDKANEKRLKRAAVKRDIKAGKLPPSEVVWEYPPELDKMPVYDLIRSAHRWGATRTRNFLHDLRISERRTMAELSDRQRLVLREALRGKGV